MKKMTMMVNENDEEIGVKEDSQVTREDIYRATGLFIVNSKNQILLARRALTKSHSPGKWAPPVAGTVEQGETYESNVIKETKEELGLVVSRIKLEVGPKFRIKLSWNYFAQMFIYRADLSIGDIKFDKKEISELRWFLAQELKEECENRPDDFVSTLRLHHAIVIDWLLTRKLPSK